MVEVDILKDRGVMVRENSQGWLENAYNLRIINKSEHEQTVTATVKGFDDIALTGLPENGIKIAPRETVTIPVQVSTLPEYAEKGSQPIEFTFTYRETDDADAKPTVLNEKSNLYWRITTVSQPNSTKPWYKHIWPWVLMAGPIFVVIASVPCSSSQKNIRQTWFPTITIKTANTSKSSFTATKKPLNGRFRCRF